MENKVVVISEFRNDDYGNMFFKDATGKEHKIGSKREPEIFELIENNPGRAVELIYSNYKGKDYISGVKLFEGEPPIVKEAIKSGAKLESVKDKPDPRNRAFALSYAKDIAVGKMGIAGETMTPAKVVEIAKVFNKYLETGE